MSRCKSCQAPITWAVTEGGKKIPLDAASKERRACVIGEEPDGSPGVAIRDTYLSHFATCPDAAKHRRSK